MKKIFFTIFAVFFCCATVSAAQLTSAQRKAKTEIFNALKRIATNVSEPDEETINFEVSNTRYRVHISSKDYNPLYITIMLAYNMPKEYDTDIVRIAAINAAGDMPVFVANGDGYLIFDCEMYAVNADPFIAVLPNMIKALQTSWKNFGDAYKKAKEEYVPPSRDYSSVSVGDNNVYIYPKVASTNDGSHLYVTKVTLGSQYTILDMTSYNGSEYAWCRIAKNSYLSVNGKRYTMERAEGIAISPQQTYYPDYESGGDVSLSFKLYFPALPSGTTKFDFSEGTSDGWEIKGIELRHGQVHAVKGNQVETDYHKWECRAVEVQDGQTIVTKTVTPKKDGTYVYSSQEEYIEDADTGRKYYLTNSTIGFEDSPTISNNTNQITFYEIYPALPSNVKRININSGHQYYVENMVIR